ncbi:hypothetical protein IRY44_21960 [Micromonospora sp. ANENR4]|uniref:hypothetical protein n=1 Tax=Micromonospora sp. ANENR4 TaxID=2783662 RepID=UPI00188E0ADD|nr:hypothetical protein [Micromonospora sp. ANENR4]MBF5032424.1 hypothetical protein [Micromonospora sp. ANENR4]
MQVDQDRVDQFWAEFDDGPEVAETPAEILDRHFYSTLAAHDPALRLARRLNLRVLGDTVHTGRLDIGIAYELFHAFSQEVAGAAEANSVRSEVSFELAGVSRGSAVMHLVPSVDEDHGDEGQIPLTTDPLDVVLSTITDLHSTAENEGDLRRFARYESLVRGLRSLATTLDNHNLELEVGWRSATGRHRNSHLSERARRHIRQLWEVDTVSREFSVFGRVVKLDLSGRFDIKLSPSRTSKRYEIQVDGEERLVQLGLQLGESVGVVIREEKRINHLGIEQSPTYHFVSKQSDQAAIEESGNR